MKQKYFDKVEAQSLTEDQKQQVHGLSEMLSIPLQDAHILCNDCKWIQSKYPLSMEEAQKMLHWGKNKSSSKKKREHDKHKQLSQEHDTKNNNNKQKDKNSSKSPTNSPSKPAKPSKSPQKQHRTHSSPQNNHNHDSNNKNNQKFGGFVPHQHQKSGPGSNRDRDRPQTPTKRGPSSNHRERDNRDNRDHRDPRNSHSGYYNEYNDNNYNQHRSQHQQPPRFRNNGHDRDNNNNYHHSTPTQQTKQTHREHRDHRDNKSKLTHPEPKSSNITSIASNRIVLQTSPSASRPPSNPMANQSSRSGVSSSHSHTKGGNGRPPHLAPPNNHRPNSNKIGMYLFTAKSHTTLSIQ